MRALSNKHYSGHCKATQVEGDQRMGKRDLEKEMWTSGFNYSWIKMEATGQKQMHGDKLVVIYALLEATRHKSSQHTAI